MSSDKIPEMKWMYDGQKSLINAEDYLTGRKIDRGFELYNSDFKVAPSKIDKLIEKDYGASSSTGTLLNLETIKKEDPLVAIKVKEQNMRREILENPLKLKRFQAIVMSEMAKKMGTFMGRRKGKNNRSSSSSDSERSSDKHKRKGSHKKSKHSGSDKDYSKKSKYSSADKNDYSQHNSRNQDNEHDRSDRSKKRKISHNAEQKQSNSSHYYDKKQRSRSPSADDDEGVNKTTRNYGLVFVNNSKPSSDNRSEKSRDHLHSVISKNDRKVSSPHSSKVHSTSVKRKLTEAEMEILRREMMDNAKWRDDQRRKNLETLKSKEEEEERRANANAKGASFIKPMVAQGFDESSVEDRVKSKRHSLQRRHNAMDSNFARK